MSTAPPETDLTLINILTYVFLTVVTFGIGAGVELDALRQVARHQKSAIAVGLLSQWLVVPAAARLVAMAATRMVQMEPSRPKNARPRGSKCDPFKRTRTPPRRNRSARERRHARRCSRAI